MQIHELNTFSGTPSSNNYLAIDTGSETLKLPANTYATKVYSDATYLTETQADALYMTETQADAKYLTQTQGDARYALTSDIKVTNCNMRGYGVNNGASVEIPMSSSTRGIIFTSGAASSSRGMYGFGVSAAGAATASPLISASGITLTNGTNKITVDNTSGAYASLFVLWQ